MARPVAGDVIVIPFPYSDLSKAKRRPALVVAPPKGDDIILCQITTRVRDGSDIEITSEDFSTGQLKRSSFVRPHKIFTLDKAEVLYVVGHLKDKKLEAVREALVAIIRGL